MSKGSGPQKGLTPRQKADARKLKKGVATFEKKGQSQKGEK